MKDVATVLTVYGIETLLLIKILFFEEVATVLTVYGIETRLLMFSVIRISF